MEPNEREALDQRLDRLELQIRDLHDFVRCLHDTLVGHHEEKTSAGTDVKG